MPDPAPEVRLRPLRATELLDTVFSLYRRNFWLFLAVIAIVQVPYQIVVDLLDLPLLRRGVPSPRAGHALTSAQLHLEFGALGAAALLLVLLALINVAVVVPLQTAAFTKAVADRFLGRSTSAPACYRFAVRRWGQLVLLGLTYLGLTLAAIVAVGVVAVLLTVLLRRVGLLLSVLVVLVAIIAAVVIYVRLMVATSTLVLEGLGPWDSIRRSWRLTSGHAGRAFGVLISLILVELLLVFALGILEGALVTAAGGTASAAGVAIRDVGGLVAGVLVAPVLASGITLLYFDLRVRKEAFDLELLAQQISAGSDPA